MEQYIIAKRNKVTIYTSSSINLKGLIFLMRIETQMGIYIYNKSEKIAGAEPLMQKNWKLKSSLGYIVSISLAWAAQSNPTFKKA